MITSGLCAPLMTIHNLLFVPLFDYLFSVSASIHQPEGEFLKTGSGLVAFIFLEAAPVLYGYWTFNKCLGKWNQPSYTSTFYSSKVSTHLAFTKYCWWAHATWSKYRIWNCELGLCHSRRCSAEKEYSRASHPPCRQHLVSAEGLIKEIHSWAQVSQSGCVTVKLRSWTFSFLSLELLWFASKNKNAAF